MRCFINSSQPPQAKGRGSQINPPNRFLPVLYEQDFEQLEHDTEYLEGLRHLPTKYYPDHSLSLVMENQSPDIGFRYSVNPYRGCAHGCAYCYARPTHEYHGLSAGTDFETKIFVKERAPELFRDWLARDQWSPEVIVFSGVTDCYQPAEKQFELTRSCLEIAAEARQPISIITKNALILRDLDLLSRMAEDRTIAVNVSITTLQQELTRTLEPRTSAPTARLRTVRELSQAGVPVNVMVAPVIPGLNDSEIPQILEAAADAGAQTAHYVLLRLPYTVKPVFLEWLERTRPNEKARIESRIRACRDGNLYTAQFGKRMKGTGTLAEQIGKLFRVFAKKHGLDQSLPALETKHFRSPLPTSGQLRLF